MTRRAAGEIREAASWWRVNRPDAPDALHEELARAFTLLVAQPRIGTPARSSRLPGVRRVLLGRVRYHLYRIVSDRVEVLAFWHVNRGTSPGIEPKG